MSVKPNHERQHQRRDPEEIFWSHVDVSAGLHGCWIWTGPVFNYGYGMHSVLLTDGRRRVKKYGAHRFSYALAYGSIPDGLEVCHNCPDGDNPLCVNPAHLWLGTRKENQADMVAKGRAARGSSHGSHTHPERWRRGEHHANAKYSDATIAALRARFGEGIKPPELAEEFAIPLNYVISIIKGKTRVS